MKKIKNIKNILCTVLILTLCLTETGLQAVIPVLGDFLPGKITAYAEPATPSGGTPSETATESFVPAEGSGIEFYSYYTKKANNKAWYKDREGNMQYRIYGTPYEGTTGWYVADSNYKPDDSMREAVEDIEYMESAPLQYEIYGKTESGSGAVLKEFLDGNADFADDAGTGLAEDYTMEWTDAYNAPYLEKDENNVYGTKGAFELKRKDVEGEQAIYYIAYGKILNDQAEGELQWFLFTQNTGVRYSFTYKAGSYEKKICGAALVNSEIEPIKSFPGYTKPKKHVLTGEGDSWDFEYTPHKSKLRAYDHEGSAYKETEITYDEETKITDHVTHNGYTLKYYCFPKN